MQPSQDPYTIDYLNQIAPPPQKSGPSRRTMIIVGAAAAIVLLIAGWLMMASSQGPSDSTQLLSLKARIATLQTIVDKRQKQLGDSDLRATNSSLSAFLRTATADIADPMAKNGVKDTADKSITAAETSIATTLNSKLDDAQLNGTLDRTYASEMNYQIQTLSNSMYTLYTSTRSASLKAYLDTTDKSLEPVRTKFKDFANSR